MKPLFITKTGLSRNFTRFSTILRARRRKKTTRSAVMIDLPQTAWLMARDGGATTGFICVDKDGYDIKRDKFYSGFA
nr:hypothetical protein [uncultured Campylobacter sp.]